MYKIQYIIFKIFRSILLLLPEKLRFKMAETLGNIGYRVIKKRRLIALANLKLAFPNKSNKEIEKIAKESYRIMAKSFLSTLWFDDYLKTKVNLMDFQRVLRAKDKGKGVAIALIHMGNMEATLKAAENCEVVTVAKKQRNPYIDKFITDAREKLNIILLKKSKQTSRELREKLEEKRANTHFS